MPAGTQAATLTEGVQNLKDREDVARQCLHLYAQTTNSGINADG